MVKGTTRQVVVVNGPDPKLFDQAIFLVRDDVLMDGGISEDDLLKEARNVCRFDPSSGLSIRHKLFWSFLGAAAMGCLWLLFSLLH